MNARERLTQLVDLASSGAPEERRTLAMELANVLVDWPKDYPAHMRLSFGLLLQKIAAELDSDTRKELATRFAKNNTAPLALVNELFFDGTRTVRDAILARNMQALAQHEGPIPAVNEAAVIKALRDDQPDVFARALAGHLGIPLVTAHRAIADANGEGLAILCKGAKLSRTTFSTIVMLTDASLNSAERKLEMYDAVAEEAAARMVQFWRAQRDVQVAYSGDVEAA